MTEGNRETLKSVQTKIKPFMILKVVRRYLQGILLAPWILVFGMFILINVLFFIFNKLESNKTIESIVSQESQNWFVKNSNLILVTGVSLLLNYTVSFFVAQKYPKLETLSFLTSVFLLFLLIVISWSYFRIVLGIA